MSSWPCVPVAVASAVLLACVAACEETGARPTTTVSAPDSADQVLEGFSHYVTNQGVRRSRVEADTAYFYEPTQLTELRKVKVTFYDLKGEEGSTLTAKSGTYRWQDGSMEANGNVVVVTPDGRRLTTERLRYDNATNMISTDQHFAFDRGEEHLEGNSFRSDPDFRNVVTDKPRGVAGNGMLLPGQEGAPPPGERAAPGPPGERRPPAPPPARKRRPAPNAGPAERRSPAGTLLPGQPAPDGRPPQGTPPGREPRQ